MTKWGIERGARFRRTEKALSNVTIGVIVAGAFFFLGFFATPVIQNLIGN